MDTYRALIHENIDYGNLLRDHPYDADLIDGYVELMVEACCTQGKLSGSTRRICPLQLSAAGS